MTGTMSIVGIGPGLPEHLTQAAHDRIVTADAVIVSSLYQSFLESGDVLNPEDPDSPELITSAQGEQTALARTAFERVRAGEDIVHVSGGDPNVYGKSDLLFAIAAADGVGEIDIEVLPGVTAALGGAATLGAPLTSDFAVISLSERHVAWTEIEQRLRAATRAGFALAIYNGWRQLERAFDVIRDHRSETVPVAMLTDIARGDEGRAPTGESVATATLGSIPEAWLTRRPPGTTVIVGTEATRVIEIAGRPRLVTPRGDFDVEEL